MKSYPILFNDDMVRAILAGRKTVTRRPVKPDPMWRNPGLDVESVRCDASGARWTWKSKEDPTEARGWSWVEYTQRCPLGAPGDELWVREAHASVHPCQITEGRFSTESTAGIPGPPPVQYRTVYRADGEVPGPVYRTEGYPYRTLNPAAQIEHDSAIANLMRAMLRAQNGPFEPFYWTPSIHMPRWASRLTLTVTSVHVERVQDITEDGARAEGFDSRAAFADAWSAIYPKTPWDANPWAWTVGFEVKR